MLSLRTCSPLFAGALGALAAWCPPAAARDYFVAPDGNDANAGTREAPFRTIQRAADVMQPGDVCLIREGTYRETVRPQASGEAERPLRFAAYEGERVVISGADALEAEWSVHEGAVLRAETNLRFIQLFVDGRMMHEARWPNSPLEDLMDLQWALAGPGTGYEQLRSADLPEGDWEGAVVLIWPGARWYNATRRIVDYATGEGFRFDRDFRPTQPDRWHGFDPREPKAGNPFVIYGALAGLDNPGEWFLDEEEGVVYLWPQGDGTPPERTVEVKQRALAFDLGGLSHVHLQGLSIFAAAVRMADATSCLVEDCHLRYPDHFREFGGFMPPETANVVTGRDNEWRRCSIVESAGTALRMAGENNRLINSIIHDANYSGSYQGALDLRASDGAVVSHCTIFRAGRDIIQHHGSKRIRLEYNRLYRANMLNHDSGAIYSWGTDSEGGVIAHNWVHDNVGSATVGIYLDNFCRNFTVHHNVSWNNSGAGITLNSDSTDNLVANNTLVSNGRTFGTFTYRGETPTQKGTRVINNLVVGRLRLDDPSTFVQGELGPEVSHNGAFAIDARGVPTADSGAIDAGMVIPGITDGHVGAAPDIGAYEHGGEHWVAGADWDTGLAPPPPPMDLSFRPRGAVTEEEMIAEGLVLWLDASAPGTVETDEQGRVLAWRDRSGHEHDALPANAAHLCLLAEEAVGGRPVVRGDGRAMLRVGTVRAERGALTVLVVSQALEAGGPAWQRIIGATCGEGDDWIAPNWMIMRPGGAEPAAYGPRLFTLTRLEGHVLDGITLIGSPITAGQCYTGDVAEVLIYDRRLQFDEEEALEQYLGRKWGIEG